MILIMNSNKIYNMCRYIFTTRIHKNLVTVKYRNYSTKYMKNILLSTTLAAAAATESKPENIKQVFTINHGELLLQEFLSIEAKLKELIKNLQIAICETSEKYRHCLEKQIHIITGGINIDSNNKYWDQIVELRNEAEDFKREFENYKNMVQFVGQTALSLALCTSSINVEDSQRFLCNDYFDLERVSKEEVEQNKRVENMLLEANANNIIEITGTEKKNTKKK